AAAAPLLTFATKAPEPAVPAAAVPAAAVPSSSSLFSGISFKPAAEAAGAGKSEPEKASGAAPAVSATPLFGLSKPAAEAAEKPAADVPDNTSEVATAPTTPVFTFAKASAADTTPSAKTLADTWGKSTAPFGGVFGVKPATAATANTTGATTPELAPKPVASAPTFSFGLSKPAATTAAPGLFSFGAAASSVPATTAAPAEDKPKPDVKFSFGSLGASSASGTQTPSLAADKPAQQTLFGQLGAGASSEAPNILTAKRTRGDEAAESSGAAPKPAFSFAAGGATGGGFSLASSTSNAPAFGSLAAKDTTTPAFGVPASSTAPESKPGGAFSFGGGAAAPSSSGSGVSFTFGLDSKPLTRPVKVIDATMDSSDSMATTSAPSNTFGSGSTSTAALPFGSASNAPAASTSGFSFGSSFGGSTAPKTTAATTSAGLGAFGTSTMASAPEPAAK
ncbi:hypothetical protein GGI00_005864, partial [Coemansia sp. RSA 2681]